jgi:hypothetical protein
MGVALALARDAPSHPGEDVAALLRDRLAAVVAMGGAFARRRFGAGALHGILHRVFDLVLHRAVARPAASHQLSASSLMVKQRRAQISFLIVASAPPSISQRAPLT